METPQEKNTENLIHQILGWLYKAESILSKKVELIEEWVIQVEFIFPEYPRTISPLQHVSANQINEAVMEWTYLVIGLALKQGLFDDFTFDDFLEHRTIALYRDLDIKYKKQITSWEIAQLIFSLWDVKNVRWKFSTIEVHFTGFAEWVSKSCLAINEYIGKITK